MSPTQIELGVPSKPEAKANNADETNFNLKEFLSEVKTEFEKISWPSKDQISKEFVAVLVLVAVLSGIIFGLDIIFGYVVDFFMGRL